MATLAERLTDSGYSGLFLSLDDAKLNAIWGEDGAPKALAALVHDTDAAAEARFLAAEVLFRKQTGYPPEAATKNLVSIYTEALRKSRLANIWGMPGALDGLAGKHVVALGKPAAAALMELLDDTRRILYSGSEEATEGNSYTYRVKDVAAFLISKIHKVPYTVHKTPPERDTEIEQLRAATPPR